MNIELAQSKQRELHDAALRLLTDKGIPELLRQYGEMRFVGSYACHLMVKPDIDIELVNPKITADDIVDLTGIFFKMKDNYSVEIADGTEYVRRPGHPRGYFIGVNIMHEEVRWHIDVWITREPIDVSDSAYKSLCEQDWHKNTEQALLDTILLLKHQLNEAGVYSKYASANVYEAVLEHGVRSLDDFYEWAEDYDTDALFRRGKSSST